MPSDTDKTSDKTHRGHLKIFLGAVAGVGKTYRMLAEAHRRASRSADVVIGLVETHGRVATADLVKGLEQVPLKQIEYRGKSFQEMDTAAVIARRPDLVLVDELAHTNIPGAVHEKRWQSVVEILDAGINVVSTLNVQHLESLNDVVFEITGIRVRETIPDSIVDAANEIEVTDATADAVLNRLRRGDIYRTEKIPQALSGFFKKENLIALRELALRKATEEVDEELLRYAEVAQVDQAKEAGERVVVCAPLRPIALKLIRRGYRLSRRLEGHFVVLNVRTPGASLTKDEAGLFEQVYKLTYELEGGVMEAEGDSVSDEIIRYVNSHGATWLVMGQSMRSRFEEIVKGSIVNRIMRQTKHIDIVVVAESGEEPVEE